MLRRPYQRVHVELQLRFREGEEGLRGAIIMIIIIIIIIISVSIDIVTISCMCICMIMIMITIAIIVPIISEGSQG